MVPFSASAAVVMHRKLRLTAQYIQAPFHKTKSFSINAQRRTAAFPSKRSDPKSSVPQRRQHISSRRASRIEYLRSWMKDLIAIQSELF